MPTRAEAERLDKRIRLLVSNINDKRDEAVWIGRGRQAGAVTPSSASPSWTAYVSDAFTIESALHRDQRRELVGYLSGEGMSQRAIADMVGVAADTVNRHLAGVRSRTPKSDLTTTAGLDGKTYRRPPRPDHPEPVPVEDEPTRFRFESLYEVSFTWRSTLWRGTSTISPPKTYQRRTSSTAPRCWITWTQWGNTFVRSWA